MNHLIQSYTKHIYKLRYQNKRIWDRGINGWVSRPSEKEDIERLEEEIKRLEGL